MLNSKKQVSLAVLLGFLGGMTQSSFCYAESKRPLKSSANIVSRSKESLKNKEELENSKVNTQNSSNLSAIKLKKGINSFGEFLFSTWERRLCTALAGIAPVLSYLVFKGIKKYNVPVNIKEVKQDNTDNSKETSKTETKPGTDEDFSSTAKIENVSENKDSPKTETKEVSPENVDDPNKVSDTKITPKTENIKEGNDIPETTNKDSDVHNEGQPDTFQKIFFWLLFSPWRCSPTISLVAKIFGFYENFNRLFNITFCPDEIPRTKISVLQFICLSLLFFRFFVGAVIGLIYPLFDTEVRAKFSKKEIIINVFKFLEPFIAGAAAAIRGLKEGKDVKDKISSCLFYTVGFDFFPKAVKIS